MKNQRWAWFQRVLNQLEQLPFIATIPSRARVQVIIGSLIAAIFLFVVCAIFGALNRGWLGAVVGASSGAILGLFLGLVLGKLYTRRLSTPKDLGKLEIQLDQSTSRYLLGDTVSGQIRLQSFMPLRCKGGKVSLTCQSSFSYAAPEDAGQDAKFEHDTSQPYSVEAEVIPPGDLRRGSVQGFAFNLVLPQLGLPTHHGYLCTIQWTLHAFLGLDNEQPLEVFQELLVESQPVAVSPETEYRQTFDSRTSELCLVLPRIVYAEGEAVSGQVLVSPKKQVLVNKLRIMLLRIENTVKGDNRALYITEWDAIKGVFQARRLPDRDGTTYVWLEDEEYLYRDVTLRPTEPVSCPFTVKIPREWHPTIQTEQGSITWNLGVFLACEGQVEQQIIQELYIHTCVPRMS